MKLTLALQNVAGKTLAEAVRKKLLASKFTRKPKAAEAPVQDQNSQPSDMRWAFQEALR